VLEAPSCWYCAPTLFLSNRCGALGVVFSIFSALRTIAFEGRICQHTILQKSSRKKLTLKIFFRYHSMDCTSIQANSKGGSYWANAAHFLLLNQEHGSTFYYGIAAAFQTQIIGMEDLYTGFKVDKRNLMLSHVRNFLKKKTEQQISNMLF
jgi:hypothetical protein